MLQWIWGWGLQALLPSREGENKSDELWRKKELLSTAVRGGRHSENIYEKDRNKGTENVRKSKKNKKTLYAMSKV